MVSVPVLVYDKAGRFVDGLKKEDIQILEDGVPQEITVPRQRARVRTGSRSPSALTLDTSGSMQPSIKFLKEAANLLHRESWMTPTRPSWSRSTRA